MGDEQDRYNLPHQATLTHRFFMSDREVWEVWRDLFQQFGDDNDYPAGEKPQKLSGSIPAGR